MAVSVTVQMGEPKHRVKLIQLQVLFFFFGGKLQSTILTFGLIPVRSKTF